MNILILGRTNWLFDTMLKISSIHNIVGIISAKSPTEYSIQLSDYKKFAKDKNIPFFEAKYNNKSELKSFIKELGYIDVGVSVNFPFIIGQDYIDLCGLGILNAHGGDLPRYRGSACQAWAILNGENRIGLSIHYMDADKLDSGNIVAKSYLEINSKTKIKEIYNWFDSEIPSLLMKALDNISKNPDFILEQQDESKALRCFPRTPADARIDWSKSALDIQRLVNASGSPYDGAFTYYENEKIFIIDVELYKPSFSFNATFGQICSVDKDLIVACGEGTMLKINELKKENEFINYNYFNSIRKKFN